MARKILLADDSVTAQNMGRRILSDAGYEVITVNNGAAALKKIGEIKPDLIILDVYMPGYGGLEVCQRIKEAPETARIPVLLTVGKMEPFKADEAKRVRADSYIIKPFESSELLTALAKLEDRIVPVADNKKSARSGKAASNPAAAQKVEAGDLEWKNRLRIPPPSGKSLEGEPGAAKRGTEAALPDSGFRDLERKEDPGSAGPKPIGAHSSPASEITPDDIAAMVSATNGGPKPGKPSDAPESLRAGKDESSQENAEAEAATLASAPVDSASRETEPAGLLRKPELESSRDDLRHLAASEADVTAMLESLQPAREKEREVAKGDRDLIASRASPALTQTDVGGSRWMAHSIALTEQEATLMLEHEMAKTFAAYAAEEATRNSDMPTPEETASVMKELLSVVAYAEATAAVQSGPASDAGGSHLSSVLASVEPPTEEPRGQEATSSSYSESFEGAASGASILKEAISQSEASSEVGQTSLPESRTPESPEEGAAFAAAAAAGTVTLEQAIALYAASHDDSLERPSENPALTGQKPDHQAERQKETELAAAWQSWKQIRETVVGTRSVAQIVSQLNIESGEAAASGDAGFKDMRREHGAAAGPGIDNEAAVEAKASDQAIASIVDSVLADLKPKLMEEIARKMAKEKEKEKESKY